MGFLKDVLKGEIVGRFLKIMLADRHVGSKRGMPIHRLLNEDAVALVIASIPTRPALSTNDSRAPFLFAVHDHDSLALYRRDLFERVVLAKFNVQSGRRPVR